VIVYYCPGVLVKLTLRAILSKKQKEFMFKEHYMLDSYFVLMVSVAFEKNNVKFSSRGTGHGPC